MSIARAKLMLVVAVAVTLLLGSTEGRHRRGGRPRSRLPIHDDTLLSGSDTGQRRERSREKASECKFGDKLHELEEVWHPDLGPPFGVMYCVHCECVPVHKKRRIVGRVFCKNIKTSCPKPTCDDPVLPPRRCCKVCPGETNNPDLSIDVDLKREEEERNGRHYASLLSNHSSLSPTDTSSVATGRFYFRKKTLSYAFVTSDGFAFPKLLTFLDAESNIIEEFPLRKTLFQNTTGKVCGSWQRVPRRYRRQIRNDEVYVQLTNSNDVVISGKVSKHYGLSSELFSSLITSQNGRTSGAATAILSLQSATGSVHANILISGFFPIEGGKNVPVEVEFKSNNGEGETRMITEDLVVPKANKILTSIDFKTVFDAPELAALGRGDLVISVRMKQLDHDTALRGKLVPKFSCEFFDCVFTPTNGNNDGGSGRFSVNRERSPNLETSTRGLAWISVGKSGELTYKLMLDGMDKRVTSIQIDNGKKSRRLLRVVQDLTDTFVAPPNLPDTGWSNGTIRLDAAFVEALYLSNLFASVKLGTGKDSDGLRCRLMPHLLGPAHETATAPLMLKSSSPTSAGVGGIAWIGIDSGCSVNYHVRIAGTANTYTNSTLVLEDYPAVRQNLRNSALAPKRRLQLQEFQGMTVDGRRETLHKLSMARLAMGDAAFLVNRSKSNGSDDESFEIEGRIRGVEVPPYCMPRLSRNDLELMPGYLNDLGEEVAVDAGSQYATKCIYKDKVYNDGDQWTAVHEACKMCSCQRGRVVCDPVLCPKPKCGNPIIPEGECCSSCANDLPDGEKAGCFFEGDKKFHLAGTRWHPYIPPWGFSRCAICTCMPNSLRVECRSKQCPQLNCPAELQVRPNALACCKVCLPPPSTTAAPKEVIDKERLRDMGRARTDQDVLNEGGCKWKGDILENGAVWHPSVLPFGLISCVSCNCKDGTTECKRKDCPTLSCAYKIQDDDACCPRCAVNRAETKRARRLKRLMRIRNLRRMRRRKESLKAERQGLEAVDQ